MHDLVEHADDLTALDFPEGPVVKARKFMQHALAFAPCSIARLGPKLDELRYRLAESWQGSLRRFLDEFAELDAAQAALARHQADLEAAQQALAAAEKAVTDRDAADESAQEATRP